MDRPVSCGKCKAGCRSKKCVCFEKNLRCGEHCGCKDCQNDKPECGPASVQGKAERISTAEFTVLQEWAKASLSNKTSYLEAKEHADVPPPDDSMGANRAERSLWHLFFVHRFSILDACVGEIGKVVPTGQNDTHFRGRCLERVLGGKFSGKAQPDFAYGDLKLIETRSVHELCQVMTVGVIFQKCSRELFDYEIVAFSASNFFSKMKQALIMTYRKEGKQLGIWANGVFLFSLDDWMKDLELEWERVALTMKNALAAAEREGKGKKPTSGWCKSYTNGRQLENTFLGIRNDSVIFTKLGFEIISRFYSGGHVKVWVEHSPKMQDTAKEGLRQLLFEDARSLIAQLSRADFPVRSIESAISRILDALIQKDDPKKVNSLCTEEKWYHEYVLAFRHALDSNRIESKKLRSRLAALFNN